MEATFFGLMVQQFTGALIIFPIIWYIIRKKEKYSQNVKKSWVIIGFIVTGLISGVVRIIAIFVIGGDAVLHPSQNLGIFFSLVVPIVVAWNVCVFINDKSKQYVLK